MDVRKIGTRNTEVNRFGASREEQSVVALPGPVGEPDFAAPGIDCNSASRDWQAAPVVPAAQSLRLCLDGL